MQIGTDIHHRTTIVVPDATTVLEGQCWSNTGGLLSSVNGIGSDVYAVGVSMVDVPAKQNYVVGTSLAVPTNVPRATPFATAGRLAIRVQDAATFAALAVGQRFGILNGSAVVVGVGGTTAACFGSSYATTTIKGKQRSSDGVFYILVDVQ